MQFRAHRGTFAESIKTSVEVQTREELAEHIGRELGLAIPVEHLNVEYYCVDPRLAGRACYIVTVAKLGVVGFTDGRL